MRYLLLCSLFGFLLSCNSSTKSPVEQYDYTNDLINETSPYLLQHAHNPVDWKGWNEATLETAKADQKLMIVSIGYAACHWCHVMEHETFEDSTAAAVMNANFISVKVDREERPDIDQIYINAVTLMTGSAGWPLNVITLPDGRPVWGGTYFSKEDWIQAIEQIQALYEQDPQKLEEYASRLEEGIKNMDLISLNTNEVDFSSYDTSAMVDKWKQNFDTIHGGFKRAPKFMMPNNISFLLREAVQNNDSELLDHVTFTLDKMAYGGVYDHIGGGFSRYSVDERWHVPHFEKMLYDNAQLTSLYSQAYQVTRKPLYKTIVDETLEYVAREMTNDEGAFYSSLDADSQTADGELEEGAFYTFQVEELQELLNDDYELFQAYYNVNDYGKWEEENSYVLIRTKSDTEIAENFSLSETDLLAKKQAWREQLLTYREKRPKPRLDDKTQTSWNGLMLKGYVDAYKAFQNDAYLQTAIKNANFIKDNQIQANGGLWHIYKDGKSSINGYLEDYSATIDAFVALYEVTLDEQWIATAKKLADYTFDHFFDTEKGMFYFTSDEDKALMTRTFEYRDNVIPASNSMMAKNLFVLSHHFEAPLFRETAQQMLKNVQVEMETYPAGFSNWLDLLANYQNKYYEIVAVGGDALSKINDINTQYIPNKLIAGSTSKSNSYLLEGRYVEEDTFIYVCVNNACKLPVREAEKALELLK